MFYESGEGPEQITAKMRALVAGCKPPYTHCSVRSVTTDGRNLLTVIIAGIRQVRKHAARRYGPHALLSDSFPLTDLLNRVALLAEGHLSIAGTQVSVKWHPHFEMHYEASENDFHDWPGWLFTLGYCESSYLDQGPLISSRFLPFTDLADAIRGWTGVSISKTSDPRVGRVLVFIPCFAGRFTKLAYRHRSIVVEASCARRNTKVSVIAEGAPPVKRLLSARGKLRIDFNAEPSVLKLYLIQPDSTIIDYHEETLYWTTGRRRILHSEVAASGGLITQIRQGEGDQTEFKPYIIPRDKKQGEILKAVIAFANTRGGRVFFGVDDNAEVEGIDIQLARSGKDRKKALTEYMNWLRSFIAENLNRVPPFEMSADQVSGKTILTLTVSEGTAKPYVNFRTKETYIRRGSTNVKPDPETELKLLLRA